MSRKTNILRVLVSSPSDVDDERRRLESIIDEINKTIGSSSGTQLELVKRETDVAPGIGEYPQDVINQQIGDDIDIFIGILWKKFGTPTNVALSGTEEEFDRAYEKHTMDPGSIRIMFYFKEAAVNPYEIDSEQLDLVKEFRNNLGGKGILWDTYKDMNEFERKMRMHLHKEIKTIEDFQKAKSMLKAGNGLVETKESTKENSANLTLWKLLFEHDENGIPMEGNVERLIEAVVRGYPIRIRVHHPDKVIQVMDSPLLSVENGIVHASDIDQISKTRDSSGNYIYQEKAYHYYVIASSNGNFHAKRIFFDGRERNTTNSRRHMAWIGLVPPS
jgi:uncharacterized protein DUF4062